MENGRDHKHRHEDRNHSLLSGTSSVSPLTSPFSSDIKLLPTRLSREKKIQKHKPIESEFPVLQTVIKSNATGLDYRIYRLFIDPTKYKKTVSSSIAKIVENVNLQMTEFFNTKNSIFVIEIRTEFKPACDFSCIHDEGAMCILLYYVKEKIAFALNSRVSISDEFSVIVASVRNVDSKASQLLRSFSEVVKCLLKKFA